MHNYFGTSDQASIEYDEGDVYELVPLNNEFISLYFPHTDWENNPGKFTQDIRPLITNEPTTWEFDVVTNSSAESVDLRWSLPENFDPLLDVVLMNPDNKQQINMKKTAEYRYGIKSGIAKQADKPVLPFKNDPTNFMQKLSGNEVASKHFMVTVSKKQAEEKTIIPSIYYLNQNFPNPFNPTTTIEYGLPVTGNVLLKIYNVLGQEIRTLVNGSQNAGVYKILWDGKDNRGIAAASGIYLYKISTNQFHQVQKLVLIR